MLPVNSQKRKKRLNLEVIFKDCELNSRWKRIFRDTSTGSLKLKKWRRARICRMQSRCSFQSFIKRFHEANFAQQVDLSSAKQNNVVAGLLKSAMLPLQQVVDGRHFIYLKHPLWPRNFLLPVSSFLFPQVLLVFFYFHVLIN